MTPNPLEKRLEQLKLLLAAHAGATLVLVLIALGDLALTNQRFLQDQLQTLDAWFGLWVVLIIGAPTPGILLLVSRSWREVPYAQRIRLAYASFLLFWLLLLAFYLRHQVPMGNAQGILLAILIVLGFLLAGSYLLVRRASPKSEELFP